MKNLFTFLVVGSFLSSGCALFEPRVTQADIERERRMAREREQRRAVEERNRAMQGNLEDLDGSLYQVQQDLANLKVQVREETQADLLRLEGRITELENQIATLNQKRKQDRDEIIETLTQRISHMMAQQAAENARRHQAAVASSGREHIVARGETLSAIAGAYGVSSSAIIRANNLSNPNSLRIGQKLVIPR